MTITLLENEMELEVENKSEASVEGPSEKPPKHPLKLYMTSSDIKTMKTPKIAEALKQFTSVDFVIDKISKRTYAFLHFNTPDDTLRFFSDVNGKIIKKFALKIQECDALKQDSKAYKGRNAPTSNPVQQPYEPHIGVYLPAELIKLPYLSDLKNKKVNLCDDLQAAIRRKVTPLVEYSYPAQLEIKHQFVKTCVKNFTRKLFATVYQFTDTELSRRKVKKRRLNPLVAVATSNELVDQSDQPQEQHKRLLWCHPEVAKGFNGCPVDHMVESSPSARIGYRNKCEFTIGFRDDGETPEVGFVAKMLKNEVVVGSCFGALHVPYAMQELCFRLKEVIIEHSYELSIYSRASQKGVWRSVMIRSSDSEKSLMVVVQVKTLSQVIQVLSTEGSKKTDNELRLYVHDLLINQLVYVDGEKRTKLRLYDGMAIKSLYVHERTENSDAFDGRNLLLIYGCEYLTQCLFGLQFQIHPVAFFQTNTETCAALYKQAFEMLKVSNKGLVLDICSGTGTIALALYQQLVKSAVGTERHILRFIGIEMIPEAVDSAILNARINGVDEKAVTFVCGKAEEVLPTVLGSIADDTEVFAIVDPPRAGLHELGPEIDLINEKCLIFGFGILLFAAVYQTVVKLVSK